MSEDLPIFINVTLETVMDIPTPKGMTVTIRPGMMVKGKCFEKYVQKGKFVKMSVEEAKLIKSKDLEYEC